MREARKLVIFASLCCYRTNHFARYNVSFLLLPISPCLILEEASTPLDGTLILDYTTILLDFNATACDPE